MTARTNETACARHRYCAYTGDEPDRCPICHSTATKCGGRHGASPGDGSWRRGIAAGMTHGTLRPGEACHPNEVGSPDLVRLAPPNRCDPAFRRHGT